MTVAVDPDEWADVYGIASDAASVRDDVREWITTAASSHPEGLIDLVKPA